MEVRILTSSFLQIKRAEYITLCEVEVYGGKIVHECFYIYKLH